MIQPLDFLIIALATWYLAYAIAKSKLAAPLRRRFSLGGLTSCPLCLSFWVFAILWICWLTVVLQPIVWILAGAGTALNIGAWTGASHHWGGEP